MNRSALEHSSALLFRQPLARDVIRFRLCAASRDLAACALVCKKRSEDVAPRVLPMRSVYDDGRREEWRVDARFPEVAHYIKYYFSCTDRSGRTVFLSEYGCHDAPPTSGLFELLQSGEDALPYTPVWARGCVYYQIFPDRFARGGEKNNESALDDWDAMPTRDNVLGGDLIGIRNRIPYLKELGVECLYLTPVFKANFNHKYATTDYFSIDPAFGRDEDLVALVDAAHAAGLRVLLDGVFNHVGVHFPPFEDLCEKGKESAFYHWFYPLKDPVQVGAGYYECVGDYPFMPRLRVFNPQVRAYILRVLLHWLDKAHIDGWRFDVADELDACAVRYLRQRVKEAFPDALMLAETWGDASCLVNGGDQFDCAMNYMVRDAAIGYFAERTLNETAFDQRLQHILMKYPQHVALCMYNLLGSHDTPRLLTLCGGDLRRAALAYAFLLLFPGAPAVYYGDEAAMTGENDPGCRGGMRFNAPENPIDETIRSFIALRKARPCLRTGEYRPLLADDKRRLFAFERFSTDESVQVVFNMSEKKHTLNFTDGLGKVDIPPLSVEIIIKNGRNNHA